MKSKETELLNKQVNEAEEKARQLAAVKEQKLLDMKENI